VERPRWGFWASFWFWCGVARETLLGRRFSLVLQRRRGRRTIETTGAHHIPRAGGLVFCVNHYHAGLTLDVIGATLLAADRTRARTSEECAIVVGNRVRANPSTKSRFLRGIAARFFRCWSANVLRVRTQTSDSPIGIAELREWRIRTTSAPTLVFPEGVANGELGGMRGGVGRWLRGLRVPVIPVGVWWAADRWNVAFGAPLVWSQRRDLLDLQLGLAMAELLPAELAPTWTETLARWRAAH
jgi:1-acyl-sn-glycerol-3-phosphate acyltransferase